MDSPPRLATCSPTGSDNPRIFILTEGLVLAVLPEGEGSQLLELGQWTHDLYTLKAEMAFPVTGELAADAPFARVRTETGPTKCGFCHRAEAVHETLDGAFESVAFQAQPGTEVRVDALRALREACKTDNAQTERCHLLRALFDFGEVRQGAFPAETAVFFIEG